MTTAKLDRGMDIKMVLDKRRIQKQLPKQQINSNNLHQVHDGTEQCVFKVTYKGITGNISVSKRETHVGEQSPVSKSMNGIINKD
jgi:hypothetical protein